MRAFCKNPFGLCHNLQVNSNVKIIVSFSELLTYPHLGLDGQGDLRPSGFPTILELRDDQLITFFACKVK